MKSLYSRAGVLVALVAPWTVYSEHHHARHQERDVVWTTVEAAAPVVVTVYEDPGAAANAPSTSSTSTSSTSVPVVAPEKLAVAPVAAPVVSSSPSPATTTPITIPSSSSSSSSSSGETDTGSTTCTGSGMVIEWASNSETVPWSWSGGSGTTAPGSCTDLGDFSGQLAVNGTGGTIFEGNYNGGAQYFDVSFIIGFSAPMICSSSAGKSGCSIDLHANAASQGFECPQVGEGGICTNPVGSNGNLTPGAYQGDMSSSPWCRACSAPHEFFQPCAGSGYTYPYDDGATQSASGTITCCIGTSCGTTGREGSTKDGHPEPNRSAEPCTLCGGSSKRGLEEVFQRYEKEARDLPQRKHKRSGHRHAHAHGGQ